jgi:hypothetical protein
VRHILVAKASSDQGDGVHVAPGARLAGGVAVGAGAQCELALGRFGRALGLAFQIADDLLDETGQTAPAEWEGSFATAMWANFFGRLDKKKVEYLQGTVYSSPTLAGKYILLSGEGGRTVVLASGREYREVARNELEPFRSTPVFAGDRMYVRTLKALYCIGKP